MKRSEINSIIKEFEALLSRYSFALPPYLSFTPDEWKTLGAEYDEIRDCELGWDVTDYGLGDYNSVGLALITLRNGKMDDGRYIKTYAEKIMMLREGQLSPNHFHIHKMEDIINRGGGDVIFRLWQAADDDSLSVSDVDVYRDGRHYKAPAGSDIILHPGESLTLYPRCYHEFTVKVGTGSALIGEVSKCNDDNTDNRFYEPIARFPSVVEDEAPYRLLCNEYPRV